VDATSLKTLSAGGMRGVLLPHLVRAYETMFSTEQTEHAK
jgi:hypothetical protein